MPTTYQDIMAMGAAAPPLGGQAKGFGPGYNQAQPPPRIGGAPAAQGALDELNVLMPGLSQNTNTAMSNVQSLLSGMESPTITRNLNASFGAGTGLGANSPYFQNRMIDLGGKRAEARQQQGLQSLMGLLGGYSSAYTPMRGQDVTQRGHDIGLQGEMASIAQRESEASGRESLARDQWETEKSLLPMITSMLGGGGSSKSPLSAEAGDHRGYVTAGNMLIDPMTGRIDYRLGGDGQTWVRSPESWANVGN